MDLMAMLRGPDIVMDIGVLMARGWAIFMCAVVGMLIEVMLMGPVMVTGCWRLTFTVLVEMFICDAMVTGLLMEFPRFIVVVMGAEAVTGVAEAELWTSLLSFRPPEEFHCQSPLLQELKLVWPCVFRWLVM